MEGRKTGSRQEVEDAEVLEAEVDGEEEDEKTSAKVLLSVTSAIS